ncbi:uncharacterized protein LOC125674292 [Ostrea edulis]|uniref:uncharacterized protein LOC125674292 n=1 Tax=Ostrea edulis TaxID=37623 RepID=UPI0020965B28|nr:uncharacterized protein LOC125674292 [Ostrea edulis]
MKRLSLKRKLGVIEEKSSIQSVRKTSTETGTRARPLEIIHSEKIEPPLQTRQTPFPAYVSSPKLQRDDVERSTDTSSFPPMCQLCRKRKPPPNDFTQNCTTLTTDELLKTSVQQAKKGRSPLPEIKLEPSPSKSTISQCPMCNKEFDSSFTMLGVDSHLANCLSSTDDDDVHW